MSLSPIIKMLCLGFWISESFHFNGKKDLLPSIQNRGNNNRINLIMDQEIKGVGIRGNREI
jgi:hypothetical protein